MEFLTDFATTYWWAAHDCIKMHFQLCGLGAYAGTNLRQHMHHICILWMDLWWILRH